MSTFEKSEKNTEFEEELLDRLNSKYISKADGKHAFSHLPARTTFQLRGTWISLHDNFENNQLVPEKYQTSPVLIHSEQNRLLVLCDLIMTYYLPELPEFSSLLIALEQKNVTEELEWLAESFLFEVIEDGYRIGSSFGGVAPMMVAKELLLDILIQVCIEYEYAIVHQDVFGFELKNIGANLLELRNCVV